MVVFIASSLMAGLQNVCTLTLIDECDIKTAVLISPIGKVNMVQYCNDMVQ